MARRRSIYKLPRLKLKHKTVNALGALVAFSLAVLSTVAMFTHSQRLAFFREFLSEILGWAGIFAPVIFLLSGLVLTRTRWKFAQTNVLLGLILIVLSQAGLVALIKPEKAGSIGQLLWSELSSFVTQAGAVALLILVFMVGLVVLFNTSLEQIFRIFVWIFGLLKNRIWKPLFDRPRTFEAKHIPIKVSGVDERPAIKTQITPQHKESVIADVLVQNVA